MNKTAKAISLVTVLILISKPFAFIREMIIAAYYGATSHTDAYNMAIIIIGLSTAFVTAGITTVIIPIYNHKRIGESKEVADLFANNILWITSLFCLILSIIGIIFAPVLVYIFAPNFNQETAELTIRIVRIMFIFTVAMNITCYMTSMAQIYNKFAIIVITGYPFTVLAVFFTVFFAERIGIYAMVIAYVLHLTLQSVLLIVSLRNVFRLKPHINFINGDFKEVIKLSLPLYLSIAVGEINAIINKTLASGLPEGSISAMTYADRLNGLPIGVISASVLTVVYPLLSKYAAEKDLPSLKALTLKAVTLLTMTLLPIIAVSVYYARDITKIVFERGAFTAENTELTAYIFIFTAFTMIFISGASVFSNAFYGMKDTKTPQITAIIMVSFNITLSLILVQYMQAAGLALASSIAYFIYFISMFLFFKKKYGAFGGLTLVKNILKCSLATLFMIPVFFLCEYLRGSMHLFIFFAVSSALSLCVYALLLWLLKVDLFMEAVKRATTYFKKNKQN